MRTTIIENLIISVMKKKLVELVTFVSRWVISVFLSLGQHLHRPDVHLVKIIKYYKAYRYARIIYDKTDYFSKY